MFSQLVAFFYVYLLSVVFLLMVIPYLGMLVIQRSLATDLQNLSMEFRKKQSTYLKQLRQQKEVCFSFLLLR